MSCEVDGAKIADRVRELAAGGAAASSQGGAHSDRHRFWFRGDDYLVVARQLGL